MRFAAVLGWLLLIGALVLGVTIVARGWRPPATEFPIQGIDVSAEDGAIDWWQAKADGVEFAYLLATDGTELRDPLFGRHWEALRAADIRRGAILRYSLCAPAQDQADHFVATVPRTGDALPVAVDLTLRPDCGARPAPGEVIEGLVALIATVERHSGKPVLLRIGKDFDAAYHPSAAIPRNVWAIRRFFEPHYLAQPWRMWQASDLARVEGVDARVNWNVVAR